MRFSSIREFALPMMAGIIAGTFSSVFLAGNFWCLFRHGSRKDRKAPKQKKAKASK